jgi:indole-3-glycerol phosphate synthase
VSAHAPDVLEGILRSTRHELERRRLAVPLDALAGAAARDAPTSRDRPGARRLRDALRGGGISVIAEFKRRSPSAGELRAGADVAEVVGAYARAGAAALSVLTEEPNFGGSLADLRAARASSALPILRKDFIVDEYQLHEALAARADAVLLIVAALPPQELADLRLRAHALGLDALVEVHDHDELAIALDVGADLIGINNRDLRDFSVDLARTSALLSAMPAGATVVSESGIARAEQVRALEREGVHAVLVGESLMRAPDPAAALRALVN